MVDEPRLSKEEDARRFCTEDMSTFSREEEALRMPAGRPTAAALTLVLLRRWRRPPAALPVLVGEPLPVLVGEDAAEPEELLTLLLPAPPPPPATEEPKHGGGDGDGVGGPLPPPCRSCRSRRLLFPPPRGAPSCSCAPD